MEWLNPSTNRGPIPNCRSTIPNGGRSTRCSGVLRKAGVWQQIDHCLRRCVRRASGKRSTPTAAMIDSQSVLLQPLVLVLEPLESLGFLSLHPAILITPTV